MRIVEHKGNLPVPLQMMGIFSERAYNVLWVRYGLPQIVECEGVHELGKLGHLQDCEFQVLIDKERTRYYLVAMSVDPERVAAKTDTTEDGAEVVVEDTGSKPCTIVYYTEITMGQYRQWIAADMEKRRQLIIEQAKIAAAWEDRRRERMMPSVLL